MSAGKLNFNMSCGEGVVQAGTEVAGEAGSGGCVDPALAFHIALQVPAQDLRQIERWLEVQDWAALGRYVAWKYPQHQSLIRAWLRSSRPRKNGQAGVASTITLAAP